MGARTYWIQQLSGDSDYLGWVFLVSICTGQFQLVPRIEDSMSRIRSVVNDRFEISYTF